MIICGLCRLQVDKWWKEVDRPTIHLQPSCRGFRNDLALRATAVTTLEFVLGMKQFHGKVKEMRTIESLAVSWTHGMNLMRTCTILRIFNAMMVNAPIWIGISRHNLHQCNLLFHLMGDTHQLVSWKAFTHAAPFTRAEVARIKLMSASIHFRSDATPSRVD